MKTRAVAGLLAVAAVASASTPTVARARRTLLAKGVILAALLLTLSCAQAQDHILITSFNIAELGEGNHPSTRDLDAIAEMLVDAELDLIAIQELGTHLQAEQQFNNLLTAINNRVRQGQPVYFSFPTAVSGDERCGFIYRDPVVVYWSTEFETPRISRHCLTAGAMSGPGVQFRNAGTLDVAVL